METEIQETIQDVLKGIVLSLVNNPSDVKIVHSKSEVLDVFEIHVAKSDRGKVIGKQGVMAKALRHVVLSMCAKHNLRGILEICD